uniref:D7-related salivary protein n=1 Tax=Phlebotomus orientalis TaxID=99786 RepID=V5K5I8_PHLOR|nr:D7-related salivary protein [Phlebotomus orientalis]
MNALFLLCILFSLGELGYSWKYPRNADQTLWAFRSCQREGKNPDLVKKWMNWELPNDRETHCYVKCVWTNLGSYDDKYGSIKIDKVKIQFSSRGVHIPAGFRKIGEPTNGFCKDVYDKTIDFFKSQKSNLQKAYYGTKEDSNKWYSENPETKPKGTKISVFCKDKNREGGTEGTCKHACSMYYYRLVDEDNLVIPFRKLPGISESDLTECRDAASKKTGCKVADEIYECLHNVNPKGFEDALKKLDDESAVY